MATTNLGTFRNALKPVGEQICIDYNNTVNLDPGDTVDIDYVINANFVVKDIMIVKTAVDAGVNSTAVRVIRVDNSGAETQITSAALGVGALKGEVARATQTYASGSTGSMINRLVGVLSQAKNISGTANSSQLIRIRITSGGGRSTPGQTAMMIKVSLSRFSDVHSAFEEVTTVEG